jgi:hypothetical protein
MNETNRKSDEANAAGHAAGDCIEPPSKDGVTEAHRQVGPAGGEDGPTSARGGGLPRVKKHLCEAAAESRELKLAAGGGVTGAVSEWVAAQYVAAGREKLAVSDPAEQCEVLRHFARDWYLLRCGDLALARIQLDREKLKLREAEGKARTEKAFEKWLKTSGGPKGLRTRGRSGGLTEEAIRKIEEAAKIL